MKNEIKVLVVCSTNYYEVLKSSFAKISTEVQIKYHTDNYKDAIKIINSFSDDIDAIIIDSEIDNRKTINLLKDYNNQQMLSSTIIIDNIKLDCYNLLFSNYQLYNIIPKDYKIEELLEDLREIKQKRSIYDYHKLPVYDKISDILKKLGISPDKNGFHYLRKAIYECYNNPMLMSNITKGIYPLVSTTFNKKESCIERSIRSAIETGWDRGNFEYSTELFSNCVDFYKSKPTNGEFVAVIVDKLLIDEGRTAY